MVTHDPRFARDALRAVHLFDGRMIGEREASGRGMRMSGVPSGPRFAVRSLVRSPGFAIVAMVSLGLGIAANTTIFSVSDGFIFRPLPFPDPDRLVEIWLTNPAEGWDEMSLSVVAADAFKEAPRSSRARCSPSRASTSPARTVRTASWVRGWSTSSSRSSASTPWRDGSSPPTRTARRGARGGPVRAALGTALRPRPDDGRQTDPAGRRAVHGRRNRARRAQDPEHRDRSLDPVHSRFLRDGSRDAAPRAPRADPSRSHARRPVAGSGGDRFAAR